MPRPVSLTPRLEAAREALLPYRSIADIGCDHGKLSATLASAESVERVIASDISAESLDKARSLAARRHLEEKLLCREGNGFSVLAPGECEAAAVLGMGGEEMVRMLSLSSGIAHSFRLMVLQPMSGMEELRGFLYGNGYSVVSEKLVQEGRRIYQLLCVRFTGERDAWPEGFPKGCFFLGYRAFSQRDPLFAQLARRLLAVRQRKLPSAAGSPGEEKLRKELAMLTDCLKACEAWE